MQRAALLLLVVVVVPPAAQATTLKMVSLAELFAAADYVAVVDIVDRRLLPDQCGAVSVGRVVHWLKGPQPEALEFGYYKYFDRGQRYLLFLTRPDHPWVRLNSTNPFAIRAEREFRTRCAPVHTFNEVMHGGRGALRIDRSAAFGGDWAVRLPRNGLTVGATVTCKTHDTPEFIGMAALESDIVQVLRGFAIGAEYTTPPPVTDRSPEHDVTFRNASDADVVVFVRQYRTSNDDRDDTSVAKDRPDRAELVVVPQHGGRSLRLREFDGSSVTWSARPLTAERDSCSGGIALTCAAPAFEVSVSPDRCQSLR